MNESAGKKGSSLAVVEKRPHKPGGCVGIFFQLFDWNRRFTKKKLFPKKLLPPARPKQAPGKFGGDDKLPKLRLIANENSGGFPNVKKNGTCNDDPNQNPGIRPPGLVARLMGLESMPVVQQDKSNKVLLSETGNDKGVKSMNSRSGFDEEDRNLEKVSAKHELRPQKLQKTGSLGRQPLSRFGAEALHFKSVLSRSRKHHHPKLVSPVKSPRMSSGRNASRLIDVAARILEPGLQSTNRAKLALTYSSTTHDTPNREVIMEGMMSQSLDPSKNSNFHVTTAKSLKGHSCKNCGSLLDVDCSPNLEKQSLPFGSSVSNYVNPSLQGIERSKPGPAMSSLEQEKERIRERSQEQSVPLIAPARNNMRIHAEAIVNRKPSNREGQIQWHWASQQCKSQKDVPSSIGFRPKTQRPNQISLGRDRVPLRSNLCNVHTNRVASSSNTINETKDFVALNRSLSRTRSRMPVKVDNCKCDAERKSCNKRDGSLSPVRKRRSVNESSGFVSSTFAKQRNVRCDTMTGKGIGLDAHSVNRASSRSTTARPGDSNISGSNKDNDVICFTFNSPMKQKIESGITRNTAQKISISDKSERQMSSEKTFPLSGDALGALLEQKFKELTCQEEDELATGGARPSRTTAVILQELISALTTERPVSHDGVAVGSNEEDVSCHSGHLLNTKLPFQANVQKTGASLGYLRDGDHLSPGSVLEASFSNDSCLSSSVDDSSVPYLHPDSVDCSCDGPQPLESDAEFLDSATSLSKGWNGFQLVTDHLSHISEVLHSASFADTGLKGGKLAHAEEVILNAELIFRNATLRNSNGSIDFSVTQFLIYELGTLASFLWADFGHFLGVEDTKDWNQLKEFLFDCVIEYLGSRYGLHCKPEFRARSRLPLCMTADMLITEVVEEVRRWTHLAGKIPDEIIEMEMSHSLGKWTDFEIEACETGAEIDGDLLQIMVDEIVVDLCEGKLGFSESDTAPSNF